MIGRIFLTLASLCAVLLSTGRAAAQELVVDHSAPFVQVTGPWQSIAPGDGSSGPTDLLRPAGAGDATVFWPFPATASPGQYEVFARWASGPDRATNALYWVSSAAGTVSVTENQQANGGTWQSLGSFAFQKGNGHGVTLSDRSNGVVVADAVRWVGPTAAAPVTTSASNPSTTGAAASAVALVDPGAGAASTAAVVDPSAVAASTAAVVDPSAVAASTAAGLDPSAAWTVAVDAADLHAGPDAATDRLASVPQFSYLQVLGYAGDWAYVYNPRARGTAYVPSRLLGPSDPPPAWVTAPPPAPAASLERMGRVVGTAPLAFYPVNDKFAAVGSLHHNQAILVHDRIQAADSSTWYRVDGGYLAAASVRLPRTPERTFSGRWIDADLSEPAMLTAYDGNRVVLSTLAIKGTIANQTPTGVFSIQRRVEDEIMDSGTLGIPANGPGGYHLEHVLYTQYFTSDGASIHFNYWSSNFGYSGSHGCLGLDREDSQFLWTWAGIGTTVVIHA